jgi:RNA polymerase-binding transcription factor DksA
MATKKAASTQRSGSAAKKAAAKKSPAKKQTPSKKKAPAARKAAVKKAPAKKQAVKAPAKKAAPAAKHAPAKKAVPAKKAAAAPRRRTSRSDGITVPAEVAATGKRYPFDLDFLKRQRQALIDERARYLGHAERFEAEADALARDREPGDVQFDDESGEGDSIAVERERDLALSAQARQAVEEIDAALKRMENGTYGLSVVSGLPIPKERLEIIPEASMRVEEKSAGPWR